MLSVNSVFKKSMKSHFSRWYTTEVKEALEQGLEIADVKFDLHTCFYCKTTTWKLANDVIHIHVHVHTCMLDIASCITISCIMYVYMYIHLLLEIHVCRVHVY